MKAAIRVGGVADGGDRDGEAHWQSGLAANQPAKSDRNTSSPAQGEQCLAKPEHNQKSWKSRSRAGYLHWGQKARAECCHSKHHQCNTLLRSTTRLYQVRLGQQGCRRNDNTCCSKVPSDTGSFRCRCPNRRLPHRQQPESRESSPTDA